MNDQQQSRDDALTERDTSKTNAEQGLYRKFDVRRVDGSDQPGGKHHNCEYFVLDLNHDGYARAALRAYARACAAEFPVLATDLIARYALSPVEQPAAEPAPANETGVEGAKPVAWFIDWPDEPELGHYFAEEPCDPKYGRSRALGFIESRSPAMAAAAPAEEMIRFCPECGRLGDIPAGYEACCPDWSQARIVPKRFAELCAETFRLCVSQPFPQSTAAPADERAESFDLSLASIDAHDPQSFIDGARWQKARAAASPAAEAVAIPVEWDQDAAIEALSDFPKGSIWYEFLEEVGFDPTSGPIYVLTVQGRAMLDQLKSAYFAAPQAPAQADAREELADEQRQALCLAAINCPHSIDTRSITLHFDDKQPGHNALNQLSRRLEAACIVLLQGASHAE
ncbi:hypothetical protein [Burkholderia ubonensis]|uniref:hypothetical protein n=1 Tax=Burkholderia ubonensis TaxID=101571 RepID=UPI00076C9360|nr:hypothetical protein [Burkholderia ubonensis]KWK44250.1 hypothetical protein WM14_11895 [Burkholderia ubonensis]